MKNVKKIVCCLLVAVLISVTPLTDFVQIEQNINKTEASGAGLAIGGAALLALILGAYGVTVSDDAMDSVTESFSNWLESNGSDESRENWLLALSAGTVTLGAKLVADVGTWIQEKFSSLTGGSVVSLNHGDIVFNGDFPSTYHYQTFELALSKYNVFSASYPYYAVFSRDLTYSDNFGGSLSALGASYLFRSANPVCLIVQYLESEDVYKSCFYYLADTMTKASGYAYYFLKQDMSESILTKSLSRFNGDITLNGFKSNFPVFYTSITTELSASLGLTSFLSTVVQSKGYDVYSNAYTSYGNYSQSNVDALPGLVVSSSSISAIIDGVMDAVNANRVEDDAGTVTWSDTIADAVADAYAQGLEDAQANQGTIEGEASAGITHGWLSKIWDAILALPLLIFEAFKLTLTDGFGIVQDIFTSTTITQELISDIPSTLVGEFTEVFPTADSVTELITSLPANTVDALAEVFPVADRVEDLIHGIPASIIDALGFGADAGTLSDALADVKEAVLAIPASISDVIAGAIEGVFVPDLSLAEEQIATIQDSFGWVPELNDMVNDMMLKLEAGDPPTLYLDFTKAEKNKYHGAGRVLAIDFAWYAKYKPTGDLVFGAFLWVLYIWYLFKRLPDIISGAGFITRQSINADNRSNQRKGGNSE